MTKEKQFNLKTMYDWFCNTIGKGVANSTCAFFENNYTISLNSISDFENIKNDILLKGELFYTCQIPIKNKQHITLRASFDFIRTIFHNIFGSNQPVFELEKLTELEMRILNGFFEGVVKEIDPFLIKEGAKTIDPLNKTNLSLVFLVKNKDENCGKLSINIPLNRLEPKEIKLENSFEYDDFIKNFAYVDLIAGYAKLSLNDLKTLDKEDILVLEKSNIKVMTLKTPTVCREFKVNPEPSLMLDVGEEESLETFDDIEYKENSMPETKSMWDDIQIEVSAEFKKVKMTLGELKQISKGLVIDLGAVMNNEISLLVENKAVAKGELVIINDKYGVKVTEVFANKKSETPLDPSEQANSTGANPPKQTPLPPPKAQGQVPPKQPVPPQRKMPPPQASNKAPAQNPKVQGAKEDFDYSNFEE